MLLSDIRHQPWSSVTCDYYVCPHCGVVDRDSDRMHAGHPCTSCSHASTGGLAYLPIQVVAIVDLIQEAFIAHSDGSDHRHGTLGITAHQLAVIVFFVTLGEVMLGHLLTEIMISQSLAKSLRDRLLADYQYPKNRVERLFPALTGRQWKEALAAISTPEVDYREVATFYIDVGEKRNLLLHTGAKWCVPQSLAADCVDKVSTLIALFVALHNALVAPIYRASGEHYMEAAV